MSAFYTKLFKRLDERGLRLLLSAFFLALALPAAVLVFQAYGQLKWEALRSVQIGAEELALRIDSDLRSATATEEARPFGDYAFLVAEGDEATNFVQRSPLSAFPPRSAIPGVLGYFQVDFGGRFSTPLLPDDGMDPDRYGITSEERALRAARVAELRDVLARNRLVRPVREESVPTTLEVGRADLVQIREAARNTNSPAIVEGAIEAKRTPQAPAAAATGPAEQELAAADAAEAPQSAFDRLLSTSTLVREERTVAAAAPKAVKPAEQLNDEPADVVSGDAAPERQKRVEQALLPEADLALANAVTGGERRELRVRTFESELDPFELGVLDTGQLVLFRNAWRSGQRYVQGVLIDRAAFVAGLIEAPYRASGMAALGDLGVTLQGKALATLSAGSTLPYASTPEDLIGAPLRRVRLSPPFGDVELEFNVARLPRAPGAAVLAWVTIVLAAVLSAGFWLMYWFAVGQLRLARQQQDFVSAVSHELKTPLTSIRMYGEMLRSGWADETRKQAYYDYIHGESERLSRLIDNVLQLARLTRNSRHFDSKPTSVVELLDMIKAKVNTQVERAGFELRLQNDAPEGATIIVDKDAFTQIFINLVDNALKFARDASTKTIEITCRGEAGNAVLWTVRDYGPGVPKAQMKKIFELFYRGENELTRETVGTGIGLSLVRQLAAAMGGRVDVRNCEPGAEFRLHFQAA